jgi:hypothetical protein
MEEAAQADELFESGRIKFIITGLVFELAV